MNTKFAYDRMDYYSILEYLKEQAVYFSGGAWTDFSDADIGTVLLKLLAMNADMSNFQVEKGVSELYLDTVIERVNAIALCKLIGYEPRHYISSEAIITGTFYGNSSDNSIPAYTPFIAGNLTYYNLSKVNIIPGTVTFSLFEGTYNNFDFFVSDVDEDGRIYFPEYNVGTNTITVKQGGIVLAHVDNALYGEGENCFSVHIDLANRLYIQLPPYYKTILSPGISISVEYLLSNGVNGNVGAEAISGTLSYEDGDLSYTNVEPSLTGYNPETVEEIRREAPAYASTMNTLVTLNDFRILVKDFDGISDAVALDYNFPESGLIQPTDDQVNDAYKVNLYILPTDSDNIYTEVEDPLAGYGIITDSDLALQQESQVYPIAYDTEDNYFYNTNSADNTVSFSIYRTLQEYLKLRIDYETSTEPGYDVLTVKVNNEVVISASGENSNYIELENVPVNATIEINYAKDDQGTRFNDMIKVKLYGMTEEPTPVYTEEYTDIVKRYIKDVKKKKPAGILTNYFNCEYIRPHIVLKVYMDKDDLRFNETSETVANYLADIYSRKYTKIGDPLYASHISRDVLSKFDYINYLEVASIEYAVDGAIKPNNLQYIELLAENITVKVLAYEES